MADIHFKNCRLQLVGASEPLTVKGTGSKSDRSIVASAKPLKACSAGSATSADASIDLRLRNFCTVRTDKRSPRAHGHTIQTAFGYFSATNVGEICCFCVVYTDESNH
ncbi:hypothetical protein PUN28_015326 [Cardiocondyla obscurior]|uniref:Uncharacterized protein n=1 Tax=Cardiocondyla obscurior TaxID=286306 RepID=A0AAW2EUT7_9HYME